MHVHVVCCDVASAGGKRKEKLLVGHVGVGEGAIVGYDCGHRQMTLRLTVSMSILVGGGDDQCHRCCRCR